jgi:hypothetical protein
VGRAVKNNAKKGGRGAIGGAVVATENNDNNGWDLSPPQRGTKDVASDDHRD